jgi:hypothetical protein
MSGAVAPAEEECEMIATEQEDLGAIAAAVDKCENGVKRALHPANQADFDAIHAFLRLTGKSPESHPGLHLDIAKLAKQDCERPDDHELQVLDIIDSGRDPNGRATARVWHVDSEGGFMAGSLVIVLDAETGSALATGYAHRVGGGLCPAATRSKSALQATARIKVVGFYHSQASYDSPQRFGMIARTDSIGEPGNV